MKHTRENQDRRISEMNFGQLIIRLGNLIELVRQCDDKIELQIVSGLNDQYRRRIIQEQKTKKKQLEKQIKAAKHKLATLKGE